MERTNPSSTSTLLFVENMSSKLTLTGLAEHLVSGTKYSWHRVQVVYFYRKLQSGQPIFAAVKIPNLLSLVCLAKNNEKVHGQRLKISGSVDSTKILAARWMVLMDGTWKSVTGGKDWVIKFFSESEPEVNESSERQRRPEVKCRFHDWSTVRRSGKEGFSYAAVDCGTTLQEKPDPRWPEEIRQTDVLVERVVKAGVQKLVLKGSTIKKAERAKELSALYPELMSFSVGYHPNMRIAWHPQKLTTLRRMAMDPACVAIGECGLDLLDSAASVYAQTELLKVQVELACQLRKPLLLMERGAQPQLLKVLQGFKDRLPPVAVCPQTPQCDFNLYIQHGLYIIVTGSLFQCDSYKSPFFTWLHSAQPWQHDYLLLASHTQDSAHRIKYVDKVLDSEFQRVIQKVKRNHYTDTAREWYNEGVRWRRKTPLCVPMLVEMVADELQLSPAVLADKCLENSKRFFQVLCKPRGQVRSSELLAWRVFLGVSKFLGPIVPTVAAMYAYAHVLPSAEEFLHNLFVNVTCGST